MEAVAYKRVYMQRAARAAPLLLTSRIDEFEAPRPPRRLRRGGTPRRAWRCVVSVQERVVVRARLNATRRRASARERAQAPPPPLG